MKENILENILINEKIINKNKKEHLQDNIIKYQPKAGDITNLREALEGKEYIIKKIQTEDEEMDAFLFSLGCYSGESITVISHLKGGCVVSIKDGRYNIDNQLAEAIII